MLSAFGLPSGDLPAQGFGIWDSAIQALRGKDGEFAFGAWFNPG
jgi:hypothetical protein